jgi:hypothetical protein
MREPKTVKCHCGSEVTLWSSWANRCKCGQEFNGFGQQLAPRSQWGEETGEDFTTDYTDYGERYYEGE